MPEQDRIPPLREITDPAVVKAMAHPLRMRILTALDRQTASPRQLADQFNERLGTVSYHIKTLADLELIELVGSQPRRGAVEHYYRTVSRWVVSDEAWGDLPRIVRQALTRNVLHQVAADLNASTFDGPADHLSRAVFQLDKQGSSELAATLLELLTRADQIARESRNRVGDASAALNEVELVVMSFMPDKAGSV